MNNDLNNIFNEFLERYQKDNVPISIKEFKEMIIEADKDAKKNYKKLKKPKTCSLKLYSEIWIHDALEYDLAKKSVKTIKIDNPPHGFKESVKLHLLYSEELLRKLRKKLFDVPPDERREVWESFELPLREIDKTFKKVIKERHLFAKNKGYKDRIDMALAWYGISDSDYKNFIGKIDEIMNICNGQLTFFGKLPKWFYSEFNFPCYLCQLPSIPFKSQGEVIDTVSEKFEILSKFRNKINIKMGEKSKMNYKKETDSFEITIDERGNSRHKIVNLLHELTHIIVYLHLFKKGVNPHEKGIYMMEKETIKLEYKLLEEISPPNYRARLGDALLNIWEVLFMIKLYSNPDQNLGKLYASIFNRCFKKAVQKYNPSYLVNENIIYKAFNSLPHAVSHSQYILEKYKKS